MNNELGTQMKNTIFFYLMMNSDDEPYYALRNIVMNESNLTGEWRGPRGVDSNSFHAIFCLRTNTNANDSMITNKFSSII